MMNACSQWDYGMGVDPVTAILRTVVDFAASVVTSLRAGHVTLSAGICHDIHAALRRSKTRSRYTSSVVWK